MRRVHEGMTILLKHLPADHDASMCLRVKTPQSFLHLWERASDGRDTDWQALYLDAEEAA